MNGSLARLAGWRHTGPAATLFVVAAGGPLLLALALSFAHLSPQRQWDFCSLAAYRDVTSSRRLAEYGWVGLRAAVVASVCQMIAMPIAYSVTRARSSRLRGSVLLLLAAPFFASDALRAFGWQMLLAPDGWVAQLCGLFANNGVAERLRYTYWSPAIAMGASVLPLGVFTAYWSLPPASSNIWIASDDLGGGWAYAFIRIAIPLAAPGAVMGWCAMFVLAAFSSAEVRFLEGPTQTSLQTIAASLLNSNVAAVFALAAMCVLFSASALCVIALTMRYAGALRAAVGRVGHMLDRANVAAPSGANGEPLPSCRRAHSRRLLSTFGAPDVAKGAARSWFDRSRAAERQWPDTLLRLTALSLSVAAVVFVLLPVAAVTDLAFTGTSASGPFLTITHFQSVFRSERLGDAAANSLMVAALVGSASAVVGALLGTLWWRPRLRLAAVAAVTLAFVLPPEAYALSLQQLARVFGVETGHLVLVALAHSVWTVGLCLGMTFLVNSRLDKHMLESAMELGAQPVHILGGIVLPVTWRAIFAGGLTSAMLSLNEYSRAAYLSGRDRTISTEVYGRLASGLVAGDRSIYAASALAFFASLMALLIISGGMKAAISSARSSHS